MKMTINNAGRKIEVEIVKAGNNRNGEVKISIIQPAVMTSTVTFYADRTEAKALAVALVEESKPSR